MDHVVSFIGADGTNATVNSGRLSIAPKPRSDARIFDALNLSKVVYTLPSDFDAFDGAAENAYALDSKHGLLATKGYVYDLGRYDIITETLTPDSDQQFFDANGTLWFLSVADGSLQAQIIR